jgi:hypothetical protein
MRLSGSAFPLQAAINPLQLHPGCTLSYGPSPGYRRVQDDIAF